MPDEFPTLEAAAAFGVLVALARTVALWSGMRQGPTLVRELEAALRAGDLRRARSLSDHSSAATAGRFGHAMLEGLESAELGPERSVERALSRTRAGARRGHARDLAALAVLVGAGAYALRSALGVGRVFYGLLGLAIALTVFGAFLRQRTLHRLVAARPSLTEAARLAEASSAAATGGGTA